MGLGGTTPTTAACNSSSTTLCHRRSTRSHRRADTLSARAQQHQHHSQQHQLHQQQQGDQQQQQQSVAGVLHTKRIKLCSSSQELAAVMEEHSSTFNYINAVAALVQLAQLPPGPRPPPPGSDSRTDAQVPGRGCAVDNHPVQLQLRLKLQPHVPGQPAPPPSHPTPPQAEPTPTPRRRGTRTQRTRRCCSACCSRRRALCPPWARGRWLT